MEGENVSRYLESLAERVACSGEVLNINEHERGDGIVDSGINSLLAMPIRNKNDQIIGELPGRRSRFPPNKTNTVHRRDSFPPLDWGRFAIRIRGRSQKYSTILNFSALAFLFVVRPAESFKVIAIFTEPTHRTFFFPIVSVPSNIDAL